MLWYPKYKSVVLPDDYTFTSEDIDELISVNNLKLLKDTGTFRVLPPLAVREALIAEKEALGACIGEINKQLGIE